MANTYFSFKQFTVNHGRCAMKVGTDGVLLGAWADVCDACRLLDVGTGSGLIALMMAQRSRGYVHAIDIEPEAIEQAKENVEASPWKDRIRVECQDVCTYCSEDLFDVVVSNPPYFAHSLKGPNNQRNLARHTDTLDFERLAEAVSRLLQPGGRFFVVIPTDGMNVFLEATSRHQLHLYHRTWVYTKPAAEPKRVLLALTYLEEKLCVEDRLMIELDRHVYSQEYIALTKDFYLNM